MHRALWQAPRAIESSRRQCARRKTLVGSTIRCATWHFIYSPTLDGPPCVTVHVSLSLCLVTVPSTVQGQRAAYRHITLVADHTQLPLQLFREETAQWQSLSTHRNSSRRIRPSFRAETSTGHCCAYSYLSVTGADGGSTLAQNSNDLKVQASGSGGLEELEDEFMDGRCASCPSTSITLIRC